MFEKIPISNSSHEVKLEAPENATSKMIDQIRSELGDRPHPREFFQNHAKYTVKIEKCIKGFGYNREGFPLTEQDIERLISVIKEMLDIEKTSTTSVFDSIEEMQTVVGICRDYKEKISEYERLEQETYAHLSLNGENFNNIDINRLIVKLHRTQKSAQTNDWADPSEFDEDVLKFDSFDNEWQRFYQIIRNEDPSSTFGWRNKIYNAVMSIIDSHSKYEKSEEEYNEEEWDEEDRSLIYDTESIFIDLDNYFDLRNVDPRFVPTIIDLLYQALELEKEHPDSFIDDPTETISWYREENKRDQEDHENRDISFRDILLSYIKNKLKPRLQTVFETLKYDAVTDVWENSDDNYSYYSEISLPDNLLEKLSEESAENNHLLSIHHPSKDESLFLKLTKDYFANYHANDTFYVYTIDSEGHRHSISIKNLLEKNGVTNPDNINDLVGEYRSLMDLRVRASLEKTFGFKLLDLTIKEQYYFLNYLKRITPESVEVIKLFTSRYGVDGMRTFLSLERGDETLGDGIVVFGQHDEVASTVFHYYSELLNSADRAEQLVREVSNCEGDICADLANQVRENILNRAQEDLKEAVQSLDPSEVAAKIENYVVAAKEYVALLQEIGTEKIESVSPEALTEEERIRMQELLHKNYDRAYPEPENNEFKAAVDGSLVKSFGNPNTTYRILRDQGKIVSFNRFDTLRDYTGKEVSYFGSFNADPAYSGVGGIMLEETIKDQLENDRPMMAHCDPTQAITKKYIEDGFVATRFYSLAGKPSFEIWRSKNSSTQLESKEKSITELLALAEGTESIVIREQSNTETYPELQNTMGLTRYFTHQDKTYLVFEKLPDTLQDEFTPPQEDLKKAA